MYGEFVEKLKAFSNLVDGEFHYTHQPTTALKRMGWSRVEIRIPHPKRDLFYIAFSGTNSAEVYSGYYAEGNLPSSLTCRITQKDSLSNLISMFNRNKMKSGRPSTDKMLNIQCNNKSFLLKLTGNHQVAAFLENSIKLPLQFEIMDNGRELLHRSHPTAMLITLNTNEWMVDHQKLKELLAGFKQLMDHLG